MGTQYLIYIKHSQQSIMQKTKCPATWTPPPPNSYKINVEGAVFAAHKSAGVGILIRDEGSRLVGACSKKLLAPLGAVQAEAEAIELGLQFAKDMLIQEFVLLSDSLILVNALIEGSSASPYCCCCSGVLLPGCIT